MKTNNTQKTIVHLSGADESNAEDWGLLQHPRKKNWLDPVAVTNGDGYAIAEEGFLYRGRHKGRRGSNYQVTVPSYGWLEDGVLYLHYLGKTKAFPAWKGYHYGEDINGLYVAANAEPELRYHPHSGDSQLTLAEFRRTVKHFIKLAKERRAGLRKAQKERKENYRLDEKARRLAVLTMRDSVESGNCMAGTLAYMRRHKLPKGACLPLDTVPELQDWPVARAVEQAVRRTKEDIQRGYCFI